MLLSSITPQCSLLKIWLDAMFSWHKADLNHQHTMMTFIHFETFQMGELKFQQKRCWKSTDPGFENLAMICLNKNLHYTKRLLYKKHLSVLK